jgi:hypothetical protein
VRVLYEELVVAWNSGRVLNKWDKFAASVNKDYQVLFIESSLLVFHSCVPHSVCFFACMLFLDFVLRLNECLKKVTEKWRNFVSRMHEYEDKYAIRDKTASVRPAGKKKRK